MQKYEKDFAPLMILANLSDEQWEKYIKTPRSLFREFRIKSQFGISVARTMLAFKSGRKAKSKGLIKAAISFFEWALQNWKIELRREKARAGEHRKYCSCKPDGTLLADIKAREAWLNKLKKKYSV